jgi:fructose-1,6-bisphosphatase II
MGMGNPIAADRDANREMYQAIDQLNINCRLVCESKNSSIDSPFTCDKQIGTGAGPEVDLVVDAIDGCALLSEGRSGAISVAAIAPRGSIWSPMTALYMDKIVVNHKVASALVPECLDAPAAWTLALIARVKKKTIRELTVYVLDRPRHAALIEEIRSAGARVMLRTDGDIAGALLAAYPDEYVDVLFGIGGATEGMVAACAIKAMRGAMLGRLAPQSEEERAAVINAGLEPGKILDCDQMVGSNQIFFAATGITDGPFLAGVRFRGLFNETQSVIIRGEFGTRRIINAEHPVYREN